MAKPWTDRKIRATSRKIDDLNMRVELLVRDIKESGHGMATPLAEELEGQCVILACARDIVDDFLDSPASREG